jgi:hypothetical protein
MTYPVLSCFSLTFFRHFRPPCLGDPLVLAPISFHSHISVARFHLPKYSHACLSTPTRVFDRLRTYKYRNILIASPPPPPPTVRIDVFSTQRAPKQELKYFGTLVDGPCTTGLPTDNVHVIYISPLSWHQCPGMTKQ